MNVNFPKGCQYCIVGMHDKCLDGKKTITTNQTVTCGCKCEEAQSCL